MKHRKAHFLSDLHLFANRSFADAVQPAIQQSARDSHSLILGGDIFDFRWSRWQDHATTIRASVQWLESLLTVNPECRIHYVLGNHDASQAFTAELERLSEVYSNLEWHPHLMRLQDKVFLHGDVIDARIPLKEGFHEHLDLLRKRKDERALPAGYRHKMYDAAVKTHVHRLVASVANPKVRVLTRISDYLEWAGHGLGAGVQDVYFGHTHCPLDEEPFGGMRFHNPGATIKGMRFRLIEIPLDPEPSR